MKIFNRFIPVLLLLFIAGTIVAQHTDHPGTVVHDKLVPSMPNSVKIDGYIGEKIDQCIQNRLMVQNVESLLDIFRTREKDNYGFNGEFFGKWSTAAALSIRYQPNKALQEEMEKAVGDLIKTQSPDGYITTYKNGDEFQMWDVWNQKYVLLGLVAQFDLSGNKAYLDAAVKSADHLMSCLGPGKISLEEYGHPAHKGGCNYSILEPIVLLYERTGENRFLAYANYIVGSWSKPGKYTKNGVHFIEDVEKGVPLAESEVIHSYTLMSNFEGLCELYRATGNKRYLNVCVELGNKIIKDELMIDGSVSNHESWYNGATEQTEMLETPQETCATATWMKFCYQLLRLTGDPKWADQLEVSLYNALLGAMMPRGEWWAYNSPLNGERVPSNVQGTDLSCCVSSGPRGLMITPGWAAMNDLATGPVMNLYFAGTASFKLSDGTHVTIVQETDYPVNNLITLDVVPDKATSFELKLRIPEWSKQTILKVNGKTVPCKPGSYARIKRSWKKNDRVTLELDLRGRIIRAPSGAPQQAIMRGPVLLALDNRLVQEQDSTVWLIAQPYHYETYIPENGKGFIAQKYNFPPAGEQGYLEIKPITSPDKNIRMVFDVSFIVRPWHFFLHHEKHILMCDYASAGNEWSTHNSFRVWLPQPLFMGNLYSWGAGRVLSLPEPRCTVPSYILKVLEDRRNK
jgi:uncharacterized protein